MIKIITKKRYRKMNREIIDLRNQIKNTNSKFENIENQNIELGNQIIGLGATIDVKNNEIKKLKSLLTKNKISYEHLYKKEIK